MQKQILNQNTYLIAGNDPRYHKFNPNFFNYSVNSIGLYKVFIKNVWKNMSIKNKLKYFVLTLLEKNSKFELYALLYHDEIKSDLIFKPGRFYILSLFKYVFTIGGHIIVVGSICLILIRFLILSIIAIIILFKIIMNVSPYIISYLVKASTSWVIYIFSIWDTLSISNISMYVSLISDILIYVSFVSDGSKNLWSASDMFSNISLVYEKFENFPPISEMLETIISLPLITITLTSVSELFKDGFTLLVLDFVSIMNNITIFIDSTFNTMNLVYSDNSDNKNENPSLNGTGILAMNNNPTGTWTGSFMNNNPTGTWTGTFIARTDPAARANAAQAIDFANSKFGSAEGRKGLILRELANYYFNNNKYNTWNRMHNTTETMSERSDLDREIMLMRYNDPTTTLAEKIAFLEEKKQEQLRLDRELYSDSRVNTQAQLSAYVDVNWCKSPLDTANISQDDYNMFEQSDQESVNSTKTGLLFTQRAVARSMVDLQTSSYNLTGQFGIQRLTMETVFSNIESNLDNPDSWVRDYFSNRVSYFRWKADVIKDIRSIMGPHTPLWRVFLTPNSLMCQHIFDRRN